MKGMKKGQSAMEYLMTYGWAILIVIIAGGVIWYYASGATTAATATKTGFSNVDVDSPWSLNSAGTLSIKAINKVGKDINVTAVYIDRTFKTNILGGLVVSAGSTSDWISATGSTGSSGSSYKIDVALEYYLTSDAQKKLFNSTGTVGGTRS